MKSRLLIALLSLGLGLNTALLVVTVVKLERMERRIETRPEGIPPESDEDGGGRSMLFGLPHIDPEELDLTPEQHEKIRRLREAWKEEETERRREFIERRQAIPRLFENEEVSMERLAPLVDQAHQDAKARLAAVVRLYNEYQAILTPEQQARFKELIREQRERHRERWERFKDRDHRRRGGDDDRSGRRRGDRRERRRGETEFNPAVDIDPERLERFPEERRRGVELPSGTDQPGEIGTSSADGDLMPPMPGEVPPLEPGPVPLADPPPVETEMLAPTP